MALSLPPPYITVHLGMMVPIPQVAPVLIYDICHNNKAEPASVCRNACSFQRSVWQRSGPWWWIRLGLRRWESVIMHNFTLSFTFSSLSFLSFPTLFMLTFNTAPLVYSFLLTYLQTSKEPSNNYCIDWAMSRSHRHHPTCWIFTLFVIFYCSISNTAYLCLLLFASI